jgi:hypothetical protein
MPLPNSAQVDGQLHQVCAEEADSPSELCEHKAKAACIESKRPAAQPKAPLRVYIAR